MFRWLTRDPHARSRVLLSEHVDGRLDPRSEAKLQAHLSSCAECRTELEELQATVALLRSTPQVEPPRSFALPYAPRQELAPQRMPRFIPARALQGATVAAAIALAVVVTGDLTGVIGDEPSLTDTGGRVSALQTEATPEAGDMAETAGAESLAAPPSLAPMQDDGIEVEQATAPEPALLPETTPPAERSTHEWVELSLALAVALLAVATALLAWGHLRRKPI